MLDRFLEKAEEKQIGLFIDKLFNEVETKVNYSKARSNEMKLKDLNYNDD